MRALGDRGGSFSRWAGLATAMAFAALLALELPRADSDTEALIWCIIAGVGIVLGLVGHIASRTSSRG